MPDVHIDWNMTEDEWEELRLALMFMRPGSAYIDKLFHAGQLSAMAPARKERDVAEAHRWRPGNVAEAGMVIGWLMAQGVDFYHPSGIGATTRLAIRRTPEDTVIAEPGDWILHDTRGWYIARELESVEAFMIKDLRG